MIYLIFGSPCSGKSTYIKEHMTENDIVCDVDLIYGAISTHDPHDADAVVYDTALQITKQLKEIILNREGEWEDAYVVSTANTKEKIELAKKEVNADKCIFINTPVEICLERAKERPSYFKYLILEWFGTKDI